MERMKSQVKKILSLLVVFTMAFGLVACGNGGETTNVSQSTPPDCETGSSARMEETAAADGAQSHSNGQTENTDRNESQILVAYFSRTGENYDVGYIEKGNTHMIADMIAEQTGGDTFEIRTVTSYPDEYDECTEVAKQEQDDNARPELAENVEDMENYGVIFLGYPYMEQGFESVLCV